MKLIGKGLDEERVEVAQMLAEVVQMLAEAAKMLLAVLAVLAEVERNHVETLVGEAVETLEALETFVDQNWDLMKSDLKSEHPQMAVIPNWSYNCRLVAKRQYQSHTRALYHPLTLHKLL